jgi:hypothetical protein
VSGAVSISAGENTEDPAMTSIRRLAFALVSVCLAAAPAPAQSPSGPESRLPQQLDEALRDFMDKMKPTFDDFMDTLGIFERMDSLENYEPPEILPNGDIIIRRREDAPPWQPPADTEEAEEGVKT